MLTFQLQCNATNWWSGEQMKWHFPTSMTTFKVRLELSNYSDAFQLRKKFSNFVPFIPTFNNQGIHLSYHFLWILLKNDNWGLKIWISKLSEFSLIWFISSVPNNILFKNSSKLIWVQFWTAVRLDLFAVYRCTNRNFWF